MDGAEVLRRAKVILLIDWPSRDVPESLARAGLNVVADEGPVTGYKAYELRDMQVVRSSTAEPTHADVVYAYRPIEELHEIAERARSLGAQVVWVEPGAEQARQIVELAGLIYVDAPSIADAARTIA